MEANDLARATERRAAYDVQMRVRETGKNQGKRVNQYQATVGAKGGAAYCIAAICTWIKEACAELGCTHQILFSPSCLRFLEYARRTGHAFDPAQLTAADLPCVGIIDHGKGLGHAMLIVGLNEETGSLTTIEANTDSGGLSRDGDGVYAKDKRTVADLAGCVRIA